MALHRSWRTSSRKAEKGSGRRRPSSSRRSSDVGPRSSSQGTAVRLLTRSRSRSSHNVGDSRSCDARARSSRRFRDGEGDQDSEMQRGRRREYSPRRSSWNTDGRSEHRNSRVRDSGEREGRSQRRQPRGAELRKRCRDDMSDGSETPRRSRDPPTPVAQASGRVPHALFLMGLPGAGKTTVKQQRMRRGDLDIEPDQFKCRHSRYSDDMGEDTDDEVHRWSVRRAADAFENALGSQRKPNLVFDSSGSNAKWLGRRIASARHAGYVTELLWVDVPVEIALLRNRDRAAFEGERGELGRFCPEEVIMDKAEVLPASFEELRREVDSATHMQNWSERSNEKDKALEDLFVYPPPRARPPSLRPGDAGYGEAPPGARSPSPTRGSMRTVRIGPWKRADHVAREKSARLAWIDRTYRGNRERFIMERVLKRRDVLLEPNRFPYQMPPDITHWTIWSRRSFDHEELCDYIEAWLDARKPHNVIAWNYDDNLGRKTISVWHVHVYFQGADGQPASIGRGTQKRDESVRHSCHRSPCSV